MKWRNELYITCYELAKAGKKDLSIAKAIGTTKVTFRKWRKRDPALRDALRRGREFMESEAKLGGFHSYLEGRLPKRLKRVWDELQEFDKAKNGTRLAAALMGEQSTRARQHIFVHALFSSNFNMSAACRKTSLTRPTVQHWLETDPDFAALLEQMRQAKKDFFESALVRLVKGGDAGATIFVNKTFNRDRGYGEKVDVNVTGTLEVQHNVVPIEKLNLPLDVKRKLLEAVQKEEGEDGDDK